MGVLLPFLGGGKVFLTYKYFRDMLADPAVWRQGPTSWGWPRAWWAGHGRAAGAWRGGLIAVESTPSHSGSATSYGCRSSRSCSHYGCV